MVVVVMVRMVVIVVGGRRRPWKSKPQLVMLLGESCRVEGVLSCGGGGGVGVGGFGLDGGQKAGVAEVGAFLPVYTRTARSLQLWNNVTINQKTSSRLVNQTGLRTDVMSHITYPMLKLLELQFPLKSLKHIFINHIK